MSHQTGKGILGALLMFWGPIDLHYNSNLPVSENQMATQCGGEARSLEVNRVLWRLALSLRVAFNRPQRYEGS